MEFLNRAEAELSKPLPESSDELYLSFTKDGNRWRWQNVNFKRRNRIGLFAFAEGLENRGRYIAAYEKTATSICAERTWLLPAEDPELNNFNGKTVDLDLGATHLAGDLAMADSIIGDKLNPEVRSLIKKNVRTRVIIPFINMATGRVKATGVSGWLTYPNNHNAVNLCNICIACFRFGSDEERSLVIKKSEELIRYYLKSLSPDGYCKEGLGYWNYGFIHFAILSEMLRRASGGEIEPMLWRAALKPAFFGFEAEICGGVDISYSDTDPNYKPDPRLLGYISSRMGLGFKKFEDTMRLPETSRNSLIPNMIFCFPKKIPPAKTELSPQTGIRTWYSNDWGVLISRTEAGFSGDFGASIIGGDNNASHNHNDIGSFIVAHGGVQVLCDPGAEIYTRQTFGPERYQSKAHNSLGHSVPLVDGVPQKTGKDAKGTIVETEFKDCCDYVKFDITSAYALPRLNKLERSFRFIRGMNPSVEICDEVSFSAPGGFEESLITFGDFEKLSDGSLKLSYNGRSVLVRIKTDCGGFDITRERFKEDLFCKIKPLRIGLKFKEKILRGTVKILIEPL